MRRVAATTILAVLSTWALGPAGASAEEGPAPALSVVGLRAAPQHSEALERLRLALYGAAQSLGATTIDLESLRERRDEALPGERAERVEALRAEARQAFLDFRFADAAVALDQARTLLFGRLADLLEDPVYIAVTLDLARVWLDMGQPELAREALLECIRIAPSAEPAAGDYPPQLVAAYHDARSRASTASAVDPPEGGRLVLAGLTSGVSYVVGGTLAPGAEEGTLALRLIVVECSTGEISRPEPLTLGDPDEWGPRLRAALAALLRPPAEYDVPSTLFFVLSEPAGAEIEVDGRDTEERTPSTVDVEPGLHRVRLTLDGYRPAELTLRAWRHQTRPVEVVLRRREESSIVRSWWLWTVVGVAAAGAIAGLVAWAVLSSSELPDVTVRPRTEGAGMGPSW